MCHLFERTFVTNLLFVRFPRLPRNWLFLTPQHCCKQHMIAACQLLYPFTSVMWNVTNIALCDGTGFVIRRCIRISLLYSSKNRLMWLSSVIKSDVTIYIAPFGTAYDIVAGVQATFCTCPNSQLVETFNHGRVLPVVAFNHCNMRVRSSLLVSFQSCSITSMRQSFSVRSSSCRSQGHGGFLAHGYHDSCLSLGRVQQPCLFLRLLTHLLTSQWERSTTEQMMERENTSTVLYPCHGVGMKSNYPNGTRALPIIPFRLRKCVFVWRILFYCRSLV